MVVRWGQVAAIAAEAMALLQYYRIWIEGAIDITVVSTE